MNSRLWLLQKLNLTLEELFSKSRTRDITNKRWVMMWFYRLMGRTYNEIARKMGKDHTSIVYGCKVIPPILKGVAEEYLHLYTTEELKKQKEEFDRAEKSYIKRPDYKHSKIVLEEETPEEIIKNWRRCRK